MGAAAEGTGRVRNHDRGANRQKRRPLKLVSAVVVRRMLEYRTWMNVDTLIRARGTQSFLFLRAGMA
jgi:hypothetical protein